MIDQCDHFESHDTNFTTSIIRKKDSDSHRRPRLSNIFTPLPEQLLYIDAVTHDFNDQGKTRGFLAHETLDFTFIGPDRHTPTTSDLQSYIDMASSIGATGLPNYQMARFPVHSNLNIDAWRHHLQGYHNKYLTLKAYCHLHGRESSRLTDQPQFKLTRPISGHIYQ